MARGLKVASRAKNPVSNLGHLKKFFGIEIHEKKFAFSTNYIMFEEL